MSGKPVEGVDLVTGPGGNMVTMTTRTAKVTLWVEYDAERQPDDSDYAYLIEAAISGVAVRDYSVEVQE